MSGLGLASASSIAGSNSAKFQCKSRRRYCRVARHTCLAVEIPQKQCIVAPSDRPMNSLSLLHCRVRRAALPKLQSRYAPLRRTPANLGKSWEQPSQPPRKQSHQSLTPCHGKAVARNWRRNSQGQCFDQVLTPSSGPLKTRTIGVTAGAPRMNAKASRGTGRPDSGISTPIPTTLADQNHNDCLWNGHTHKPPTRARLKTQWTSLILLFCPVDFGDSRCGPSSWIVGVCKFTWIETSQALGSSASFVTASFPGSGKYGARIRPSNQSRCSILVDSSGNGSK
jgi:hypothetical protein